jgi:hypothetical protein
MLEEVAAPKIKTAPNGLPIYEPDGPTLTGFMKCNARVRIIRGPIRSGTSSMCCMEIYRRAMEQQPGPDGVRRSRWAVVRNSYPLLQQSTIKTWLAWFPERDFGRFNWSKPMYQTLRKGPVWLEVVFLALDKPEDVSKLRSTEFTGVWFNELEYIPKEIFDEAESRVGYYPALKDGGPTWSGVIADLNAPTEDMWLVLMTGEAPLPEDMPEEDRRQYVWPVGWEYFIQPPALIEQFGPDGKTVVGYELNPKAENLKWIPKINGNPLYLETIKGKSKRWIDSRLMNRIRPPVEGDPVWPSFREETHVAKTPLKFHDGYPLYVGLDFGRSPAAVFAQLISDRWLVLDELTAFDVGATTFAPRVRRLIEQRFPSVGLSADEYDRRLSNSTKALFYGDPKGQDRPQSDDRTSYDVFLDFGLRVRPAPIPTNSIGTRIEAVEYVLNTMRDGMPRFLLNPTCRTLKMAMGGGYSFRKGDPLREEPAKNRYSHIADALQYMVLGAGEGRVMTGRERPTQAPREPLSLYQRRRSLRRVS